MDAGLNVSVSSQIALERRLATIADNIANANTTGFRATSVRFDEMLQKPAAGDGVSFVSRGQSFAATQSGGLEETGARLDFAIRGNAWFALQTPAGTAVTRDGRFTRTPDGQMVAAVSGHPVLDAAGAPIQLPADTGDVMADGSGRLTVADGDGGRRTIGAIGLFAYEPGPNFTRAGTSAILARTAPEPLTDRADIGVVQGSVERSNVDPVLEMTRLIAVHRAFDNIAALMRDSEQASDSMIRTLGGAR